uniref:Mitochondrial tRNA methylthiotransferase CDK5RAP1 n=1 Tax=Eptatretus burgeri TaxID=7764 RepID=A0A8C4Q322_EPTBU
MCTRKRLKDCRRFVLPKPSYFFTPMGRSYLELVDAQVFFETLGCQMNVSDTEIAWAILQQNGFGRTTDVTEADIILLVTCTIREKPELTVWKRVAQYKALKRRRKAHQPHLQIGILGCMAEQLRHDILERERAVDVVAGPDAYRDLPRLLATACSGQQAINVQLSVDETYADVTPVRMQPGAPSAFVSITRGCNNMCSYCVVPFTRGRERSRPLSSVLEEVRNLSQQGVKEVVLLGQNVNSYLDPGVSSMATNPPPPLSKGFRNRCHRKVGGTGFAELLDQVSSVDPEMRIRFTSPHPKDFPDEVLHVIRERPNICKQIHLPAQSGSTRILEAMKRGHTREAYLDLVEHIKKVIPGVCLSSDFIAGFCGETEDDHQETLSLIRTVCYTMAYLFSYSMRKKTHASHRLQDNVPLVTKHRRVTELTETFRSTASSLNSTVVGTTLLVLADKISRRSKAELLGRSEGHSVVFPAALVPTHPGATNLSPIFPGDYVAVRITSSNSQTLKGFPLYHTTLHSFYQSAANVSDAAAS